MDDKIKYLKLYDQIDFLIEDFKSSKDEENFITKLKELLEDENYKKIFYFSGFLQEITKIIQTHDLSFLIIQFFNPNTFTSYKNLFKYIETHISFFVFDEILKIIEKIPTNKIQIEEISGLLHKIEPFAFENKSYFSRYVKYISKFRDFRISSVLFIEIVNLEKYYEILVNFTNNKMNIEMITKNSNLVSVLERKMDAFLDLENDVDQNLVLNFVIIFINLIDNDVILNYVYFASKIEYMFHKAHYSLRGYMSILLLMFDKKDVNVRLTNKNFYKKYVASILNISKSGGLLSNIQCLNILKQLS